MKIGKKYGKGSMQNNSTIIQSKIFPAAFAVSFIGSIPIGSISATSLQISISGNIECALLFALATVIVEMLLVLLLLKKFRFLNSNFKFSKYIYITGILLFFVLGLQTLLDRSGGSPLVPQVQSYQSVFLLGMVISALNPFQIPYWLVWNRVFFKKQLLQRTTSSFISYLLAIGLGSFVVLYLYILSGTLIMDYYASFSSIINMIFGSLYIGIASYLTFCYYKKFYLTKRTNV